MKRQSTPVAERFWPKVDKSGECWEWTAARARGYGRFDTNLAHRISYELTYGAIPDGAQLDHVCHNRGCVRPEHLRPATNKENAENHRGARQHSKSGVRGVYWHKHVKKWHGQVTHNGQHYSLGYFVDLQDAEAAVVEKRRELFTHNVADRTEDA